MTATPQPLISITTHVTLHTSMKVHQRDLFILKSHGCIHVNCADKLHYPDELGHPVPWRGQITRRSEQRGWTRPTAVAPAAMAIPPNFDSPYARAAREPPECQLTGVVFD